MYNKRISSINGVLNDSSVVSYHREGVSAAEVERCLGILVRSADTVSFCVRKLKVNSSLGEEGGSIE